MAEALQPLIGCELASIELVRDYLQLRFDGPCLTLYDFPVLDEGIVRRRDAPGYLDALAALIGKTVTRVTSDDRALTVVIGSTRVVVSLMDRRGPEAGTFSVEGQPLVAF